MRNGKVVRTESTLVEVSHVSQTYRLGFWLKPVEVLHAIDLKIPAHETTGLLGANGAGKTTLMKLIAGLRKPTAGCVRIAGLEATTPEAKASLGFLPERPYFHDHLTGEKLLLYVGALYGMTRDQILKRIPVVLEQVGMSHARHTELRRYSKGMLQRVGIAQALLHDPELVLLDEPMSGLDPLGRKEMRDLIAELGKQGKTILFTTHLVQDAETLCNEVIVLEKGHLVGQGPVSQFLKKERSLFEVAVKNISDEQIKVLSKKCISQEKIPEGIKLLIEGEKEAQQMVGEVLAKEGALLWMSPIRPSLEDLFQKRSGL